MTRPESDTVQGALSTGAADRLHALDVFDTVPSTNTYLIDQSPPEPGQYRVAIAGHQTAGRGRNENRWHSAPESSLCLSLSYTFRKTPSNLPPLTLALGVSVAELLTEAGVADIKLKWPNDIYVQDAKLGGILTEVQQRQRVSVVAGIGINLDVDEAMASAISDQLAPPIGLKHVMDSPPERNILSAQVIEAWVQAIDDFEVSGFAAFAERFNSYDWLNGRTIVADTPQGTFEGKAAGIDASGALLLNDGDTKHQIVSGTIRHVRQ